MTGHCEIWYPAPDVALAYLPVLRRFEASDDMLSWATDYVHYHAGRLKWDVDFLTHVCQFTSCANIGAAPYLFEYLLLSVRPGVRITSIDLDPSRFPYVSDVLDITAVGMNIETELRNIGKFDCVVFCEIFEHLRLDILGTMQRVASLINDGGLLYLTMPNGLGLTALCRLLSGRSGPAVIGEWQKLSTIGHMGHVREYSAAEIRETLSFAGLLIEQLHWRRRSAPGRSIRSRVRELIHLGIDRILPALSEEIVVVARKV